MAGTHFLETAEGWTCQDTEKSGQATGTHSLEAAEGGSVRTWRESDWVTGTHSLDHRGRDLLGHGKKPTERWALTNWRPQRVGLVSTWRESDRATGTHQLETEGEGLVSTRKESDCVAGTHWLETGEGGTCQHTERKRLSDGHSLPGDHRGRVLSGHGKTATERQALTSWRSQRGRIVRTQEKSDCMTGTHFLETAEGGTCQDMEKSDRTMGTHQLENEEGGTCQDMETKRLSNGHSPTGDHRGWDLSEHGKEATE